MRHSARRTTGLTLIETTLVVATIALLMGLALPAVRALVNSFQSEDGTKSVIRAALNSARTMAVTHQRYVGVRFQKACTSTDPADPLKGEQNAPQYMIFIMLEEPKNMGGLGNGFRALEGHEPIRLPDTIGVMSPKDETDLSRVELRRAGALSDVTTFSIVFSPSGKLVVHDVRVRNRDGVYLPANGSGSTKVSHDDIFNSVENVCRYKEGMFIQDDYAALKNVGTRGDPGFMELGLGKEASVTSFMIYDTGIVRSRYGLPTPGPAGLFDYLDALRKNKSIYMSPYTGDLISSE
jgi:type II secretory pathway pseudopilin PulG